MTEENETIRRPQAQMPESINRPVGGTELSWCKAVPGGTGITVLGLLFSKPPEISIIQAALQNLQISHPILRSKIHQDPSTNTYHFVIPPNPHIHITQFDLKSTSDIITGNPNDRYANPFHLILEHEMNRNTWRTPDDALPTDLDVFDVSMYTISDHHWGVFLRLHTSACDRSAAVALLRELLDWVGGREKEENGTEIEFGDKGKISISLPMPIEDLIPEGKANKPFWARGLDVLGYSLNSFRLANLEFVDSQSSRNSFVVRLQLNSDETERLLAGCKSRNIKLCGAIAAAGMLATWSSKNLPDYQREKYAVVTLIDCRLILDPVLPSNHVGFYHSAILNTHDVCGENLWELAKRSYSSFENAKNSNKHFRDMSDLNYLMGKAIDNPGLTPSSSMRTALISVFEDPVVDKSNEITQQLGLEDYFGCASAHGVGPSIAVFDTIRNGSLDCACVYPSPLFSRELMQELINNMKKILVVGCNSEE